MEGTQDGSRRDPPGPPKRPKKADYNAQSSAGEEKKKKAEDKEKKRKEFVEKNKGTLPPISQDSETKEYLCPFLNCPYRNTNKTKLTRHYLSHIKKIDEITGEKGINEDTAKDAKKFLELTEDDLRHVEPATRLALERIVVGFNTKLKIIRRELKEEVLEEVGESVADQLSGKTPFFPEPTAINKPCKPAASQPADPQFIPQLISQLIPHLIPQLIPQAAPQPIPQAAPQPIINVQIGGRQLKEVELDIHMIRGELRNIQSRLNFEGRFINMEMEERENHEWLRSLKKRNPAEEMTAMYKRIKALELASQQTLEALGAAACNIHDQYDDLLPLIPIAKEFKKVQTLYNETPKEGAYKGKLTEDLIKKIEYIKSRFNEAAHLFTSGPEFNWNPRMGFVEERNQETPEEREKRKEKKEKELLVFDKEYGVAQTDTFLGSYRLHVCKVLACYHDVGLQATPTMKDAKAGSDAKHGVIILPKEYIIVGDDDETPHISSGHNNGVFASEKELKRVFDKKKAEEEKKKKEEIQAELTKKTPEELAEEKRKRKEEERKQGRLEEEEFQVDLAKKRKAAEEAGIPFVLPNYSKKPLLQTLAQKLAAKAEDKRQIQLIKAARPYLSPPPK